jgi:hypothetical protein
MGNFHCLQALDLHCTLLGTLADHYVVVTVIVVAVEVVHSQPTVR